VRADVSAIPSRRESTISLLVGNQVLFLINIVRNVVLIPVYLMYLDDALFGAWLALTSAVSFLWLADLGINGLIVQRTGQYYGAKDWESLGRTVVSGLAAVALIGLVLCGAAGLALPWVPHWFGVAEHAAGAFLSAGSLALLDALLTLTAATMGAILLGFQRPGSYIFGLALGQIVGIVVALVLLTGGAGILALGVGMVSGSVLSFLLTSLGLRRAIQRILPPGTARFDRAALARLLKSSSGLFLARIARICISRSNGIIVAVVLSSPLVVVLEVTRKASLVLSDALGRISMSVLPGLSHLRGAGQQEKLSRIARLQMRTTLQMGIVGAAITLVLNVHFVRLWTGERFYGGGLLNALLCLYALMQLASTAMYHVILSVGRIGVVTLAATLESALQVVLSVAMGMAWGLEGIAAASVVASGAGLAVQIRPFCRIADIVPSVLPLLRNGLRLLVMPAAPGLLAFAATILCAPPGWFGFCAVAAVCAASGGMLILVGNVVARRPLLADEAPAHGRP
jgi:O-antigen/teichoic acid export membrane protein